MELLQRRPEKNLTSVKAPAPARPRLLEALALRPVDRPPVWLMRQAGRSLPEYRELKTQHTFLELIHDPALAAEVTLQPIRRFGFDAAILFSDILVIPEALGQGFKFRETGGVEMKFTLRDRAAIHALQIDAVTDRLAYVGDAIKAIRRDLPPHTALLGFAGSPWTLANFMLEGGSSPTITKAHALFRRDRAAFDELAETLTRAVTDFLQLQIDAGVDAIQIFDSLANVLPGDDFEAASARWMRRIIANLQHQVPLIVFARGCRQWSALSDLGAAALGIDHQIDLRHAVRHLPETVAIQGNFNPNLLPSASPETIAAETRRMLHLMRPRRGYIFNLGHGVPADARLENLAALAAAVQNFS
ncbi:MAG TPA: uroporphyrinogen decarboxylase [Verrucomicrobiae bacterium]|jgi:uroporphyrinogen decarboxylase|nr:uroporphyrinogen decarboxylase [Verrucomicrobiae bacterium]